MNKIITALFIGVISLLAASSPAQAQTQYRIVELGTLGGPDSRAESISENGIVSGRAMLPSGEWHAVIWDRTGIVDLGTPPGAIDSRADAVNEFGQVAGNAEVGSQSQGYFFENGIWTLIGTLPGTSESAARDIDSGGRIVGSSYNPDGVSRAIIWDAGVLTDLGTLFSTSSASAINEAGQVVGSTDIGPPVGGREQRRGFLWENGQMTVLDPVPGDIRTGATDINDAGQICGSSRHPGLFPYVQPSDRAAMWEDGVVQALGGGTVARGINNHGQIVGFTKRSSQSPTTAFIWQDGVTRNLKGLIPGDSGVVFRGARDINDAGQIVANGLPLPDAQVTRAFLLEPLISCSGDSECDDGFFCDGVEECVDGICREGSNPCPGLVCDEDGDTCEPETCDFDGSCELGENCDSCSDDCVSFDGAQSCGDGICQPGIGEDCLSCASDCRGKQTGSPRNRFCCGADVDCTDARCNEDSLVCDDAQPAPYCCGDGVCDPGESQCDCPVDCGVSFFLNEVNCADGVDDDCDSLVDEADRDCCLPAGDPCFAGGDCCSGNCKKSSKFPFFGTCR